MSNKLNLADLEALMSPPPVLRTEDRELYNKIRARFMECLMPEDMLQMVLVQRLIDDYWFIMRYGRHQTIAVERRYQQSLEFQVQRVKTQKARQQAQASRLAERMAGNPPEVAHLLHLENQVSELPADVDEILQRTPTELEHNRALEKSMDFLEQLNRLVVAATKRFNDTLALLEYYKDGLGQRLRQTARQLLTENGAEPGENPPSRTEAPSIVPSDQAGATTAVDQTITAPEDNK
jgi:hypothetical protein